MEKETIFKVVKMKTENGEIKINTNIDENEVKAICKDSKCSLNFETNPDGSITWWCTPSSCKLRTKRDEEGNITYWCQ